MCNTPELWVEDECSALPMQLPLEIWELILKNLPTVDLLKASCVCYQWRQLAKRISHERCLNLPPRLLLELIHEYSNTKTFLPSPTRTPTSSPTSSPQHVPLGDNDDSWDAFDNESKGFVKRQSIFMPSSYMKLITMNEKVDWMTISKMVMQTNMAKESSCCNVVRQVEKVTHLSAAGHFVVCVSRGLEGSTSVLRLYGVNGEELGLHNFSGRVHKVCIIKCPGTPSLLAICVDRELKCYLPVLSQQVLLPLTICPQIDVDSRMCCDGTTLVISELVDDKHLAVYEASPNISQMRIQLTLRCRIYTSSSPLFWDLWNGFVTVVLSGGYVTTYTLSGNLIGESPMYKDLRYPNPSVLSHGLVFASTITSRTLLAYWHMEKDRDYWLVGRSVLVEWIQRGQRAIGNTSRDFFEDEEMRELPVPFPNVPSQIQTSNVCILTLAKIRIGSSVLLETTVVHYKRGLVFCGTDQGHLLVFKIYSEDQSKINLTLLESAMPNLCMSVAARPISRIVAFFSDSEITVAIGDRIGKGYIVSIPNASIHS